MTCSAITIANTLMNTLRISPTCPAWVMLVNTPKIWIGRSGIMITSITFVTIFWNSRAAFFKVSERVTAIPIPRTKLKINAVITPISGGISIPNKPGSSASSGFAWEKTSTWELKKNGKNMESVTKANVPASSVEPYAIPAVMASSFPASEPKSAIPGITNPIMISGMIKLRKLPNTPLKVAKIWTGNGKWMERVKLPIKIPATIAIIRRGNRPNFFALTINSFLKKIYLSVYSVADFPAIVQFFLYNVRMGDWTVRPLL